MKGAGVELLADRRRYTEERLAAYAKALHEELGKFRAEAMGEHSCIYATGSGGRLEMHADSDLDVFLVRIDGESSRRQSALLQSAVVRAMDACALPKPSQDGRFLIIHEGKDFVDRLGSPEDDGKNKLTARMLLILESRPLQGSEDAYDRLLQSVLDAYWQHASDRADDFMPIVLTNDIIRYWRIVLLNHEANLREKSQKIDQDEELTEESKRIRKLVARRRSSYKLRFARCLICFASLAYLLAQVKFQGTPLDKASARRMVALTPLERLLAVAGISGDPGLVSMVEGLRSSYAAFLHASAASEEEMDRRLADESWWKEQSVLAEKFVEGIFELVMELRSDNPLFRYVVV